MKEVYESPDFEVIELEGEIATARKIAMKRTFLIYLWMNIKY